MSSECCGQLLKSNLAARISNLLCLTASFALFASISLPQLQISLQYGVGGSAAVTFVAALVMLISIIMYCTQKDKILKRVTCAGKTCRLGLVEVN